MKPSIGLSLIAGVLATASLSLAACGSEPAKAPIILNTEKVERAIEQSSWEQRHKRARVSCPSGVHQKQGLAFSCTALVKRERSEFAVTQVDDAGNVRYAAR